MGYISADPLNPFCIEKCKGVSDEPSQLIRNGLLMHNQILNRLNILSLIL